MKNFVLLNRSRVIVISVDVCTSIWRLFATITIKNSEN
jgi:hypothetical protein